MTDLSKIPDLELRQKIKPINDRIDAVGEKLRQMQTEFYAKCKAASAELDAEYGRLNDQLSELLGEDREITGTCAVTGLPIFEGDETVEKYVLACVA